MNASLSQSESGRDPVLAEIHSSARLPLLVLFLSAAFWLLFGSIFGLIASIKFHNPNFLANCSCLTYGRIRPAANDAFLYGFCLQAGLGVSLWLISRLGRTPVAQPILVIVGAKLWNLGVTLGMVGILLGDATGFEGFDMPSYAALFLFLGYTVMAVFGILTFHRRNVRELYVSQWFLLAALFWFPWILSTAGLLLLLFPVRGMTQAVIAWWYANNLQVVCLGLAGLGAIFYFIPKLTRQNLRSRPLAVVSFWLLMLLGSWGGIPNSASLPAWMPAISTVATVLAIIPVIAVGLNIYGTTRLVFPKPYPLPASAGAEAKDDAAPMILKFLSVGLLAFLAFGAFNAHTALPEVAQITDLTWFVTAKGFLNSYGFFAMAMFGAIYYIVPTLFPGEALCPKLMRLHFLAAASGIIFTFVPYAIGGVVQGMNFQKSNLGFAEILHGTIPFLRASSVGDLLLLAGHVMFALNLGGLAYRFYRARAVAAYSVATAAGMPVGVQP